MHDSGHLPRIHPVDRADIQKATEAMRANEAATARVEERIALGQRQAAQFHEEHRRVFADIRHARSVAEQVDRCWRWTLSARERQWPSPAYRAYSARPFLEVLEECDPVYLSDTLGKDRYHEAHHVLSAWVRGAQQKDVAWVDWALNGASKEIEVMDRTALFHEFLATAQPGDVTQSFAHHFVGGVSRGIFLTALVCFAVNPQIQGGAALILLNFLALLLWLCSRRWWNSAQRKYLLRDLKELGYSTPDRYVNIAAGIQLFSSKQLQVRATTAKLNLLWVQQNLLSFGDGPTSAFVNLVPTGSENGELLHKHTQRAWKGRKFRIAGIAFGSVVTIGCWLLALLTEGPGFTWSAGYIISSVLGLAIAGYVYRRFLKP